MTPHPRSFDDRAALTIVDRGKLLLAPMLPGCVARRYDFPLYGDYSPVQLCFADSGPIVPTLDLNPSKYNTHAVPQIYYRSLLDDPRNLGALFWVEDKIRGFPRLDSGPQGIAAAVREAISKIDFAAIIAAGSIERILAESPRLSVPWPNFHLALCAIHLGRDQEAHGLLEDSIRYAKEDGRAAYAKVIAEAEAYLMKLESDADALRQELVAIMESNWSHFKIVEA